MPEPNLSFRRHPNPRPEPRFPFAPEDGKAAPRCASIVPSGMTKGGIPPFATRRRFTAEVHPHRRASKQRRSANQPSDTGT